MAEHAALWYAALGGHSTVAAIFKAQLDTGMASLFKQNLALLENETAASKNAYRFVLATAFFICEDRHTCAMGFATCSSCCIASASACINKDVPRRSSWKTSSAIRMLDESRIFLSNSFDELNREIKGTELALRFGVGFLVGNWPEVLLSLRNCETLWPKSVSGLIANSTARFREDEICRIVLAETVSVEPLRHMVSNPKVLGMSPRLGHRRRKRRALA